LSHSSVLRSQDLCGVLAGHRAFVQAHPATPKPFRWAVRTASDRCATDPARVGRLLVAKGAAARDGYARQAMRIEPLRPDAAEREYGEALALAAELGMRPLVAHCHLGLGRLYRRIGKREPAREHLATATTMYREMGMAFWLEKAGAEVRDRSA
jgi:hypothetical protein